jgi:hypothetical protein
MLLYIREMTLSTYNSHETRRIGVNPNLVQLL